MIIPNGGTLQNYLKTTKLNIKWEQRQSDMIAKARERDPKIADLLRNSQDMMKSNTIQGIDSKLKSGKKLSPQEMDYLREHSPELYKKAVEVAREREAYERELKQCKTKEAVQKLNMRYTQSFLHEAKTASSNGNIPKEEIFKQIARRSMAILDSHTTFLQSAEYAELPSENDKDDEKKTVKKAKQRPSKEDEIILANEEQDRLARSKSEQIENNFTPENSRTTSATPDESKEITTAKQTNVFSESEKITSAVSHYTLTPPPKPTISVKA